MYLSFLTEIGGVQTFIVKEIHQQQEMGKQQEGKEKRIKDNNATSSKSKMFSQNIEKYIKKNGSVYCSLIMQETDLDSQSFA